LLIDELVSVDVSGSFCPNIKNGPTQKTQREINQFLLVEPMALIVI
jgi:hypothetical protein